jgi:dTDP-4-amino-4,6-dideoxygalactose transaminase
MPFLPYGRQVIEDDDIEAVTDVLRGQWLTTGPAVADFEEALAERTGAGFAVACSSGTAALHLAAVALDLQSGDVVLVPSLTFLATANVARFVGAEVGFVDVDPENGLMRAEDIEAALTALGIGKARAVFPVHLNGQCADLEAIQDLAAAHDLAVVEDACHALGTKIRDADGALAEVGACQHSNMAAFSFHPVKAIAMGEGGAITSNDEKLVERLR